MGYAGHQFGNWVPRLGDGRALLLGELGGRDIHLKGSGRTPYARGGDGKAVVGPMVREHVISEAMHALGIPTTRALAVVGTGETVSRGPLLPGAILVRVAASHLRVGTFQYVRSMNDGALLRRLADHAIDRHHPAVRTAEDPYLALLEAVCEAQASLVARWMLAGFVHGVLNTDNVTISGETIDYGPCAFMDAHDPATVFSSIDAAGRYAYGNQPQLVQWDLARLAEALLPLVDADTDTAVAQVTAALEAFPGRYAEHWYGGMREKLGLAEVDRGLAEGFVSGLTAARADHTASFRALSAAARGDDAPLHARAGDALDGWLADWRARLDAEGRDREAVAAGMDAVNPVYVARNHLVEDALTAAQDGDLTKTEWLLDVLARPFEAREGLELFAEPAPPSFAGYRTFCGT